MNNTLYREAILEHWKNPQNWGVIKNPDIEIDDYNPLCGDEVHLTGTVANNKLIDLKFTGDGCVISKASASIMSEFMKGKNVEEIKKINQEDFLSILGIPLSISRIKCALLPYSALQKVFSA